MKNSILEADRKEFTCLNCDSTRVITVKSEETFPYRHGSKRADISVVVPVRTCEECGFAYTDSEADDLRHEAVCRYLNVFTPAEIIAIRNRYRLSRAAFAELTHIGEASLARWETGELIQNSSHNYYLHLLSFDDNFERLKSIQQSAKPQGQLKVRVQLSERFSSLAQAILPKMQEEAMAFSL